MPKQPPKNQSNDWQVQFVNCTLQEQHRKALKTYDQDLSETFAQLTEWVNTGYKLTANRDDAHNCIGIWVTEPQSSGNKRRRCLTARGPELVDAFRSITYKNRVILEGDWGDTTEFTPFQDGWG